MNEKIKTRVEKTKNYVKSHAPQVATAAAASFGVLVAVAQLSETRKVRKHFDRAERIESEMVGQIGMLVEEDRTFDVYPGLGIRIYPDKIPSEN